MNTASTHLYGPNAALITRVPEAGGEGPRGVASNRFRRLL